MTSLFYNENLAKKEREQFSEVFSKGNVPDDIPTYSLVSLNLEKNTLLNVLASTDQFESKGQIRRLVKQGAVKLNNQRVDDPDFEIKVDEGPEGHIIKAGKKIFIKIIF